MNDLFTHLHVHGEGSLLDGFATPEEIILRAKELEQESIALTDHGTMSCTFQFYKSAKEHGINPLVGMEAYLTDDMFFKDKSTITNHLGIIARNNEGLKKIYRISYWAWNKGFYRKPRFDLNVFRQYFGENDKDLLVLSGCMDGPLSALFLLDRVPEAESKCDELAKTFKHFVIELQPWNSKELNQFLMDLGDKKGIPLVVTCDTHYAIPQNKANTEISLIISQLPSMKASDKDFADLVKLSAMAEPDLLGKINTLWPHRKIRFDKYENYIQGRDELTERMKGLGIDREDIYDNTFIESKNIHVEIKPKQFFPRFDKRLNSDTYLRDLAMDNLKDKGLMNDEYVQRLEDELRVIKKLQFADYFLVVWDIVHYAKTHDIWTGPGRGSVGGSLLAYALGITRIDPIKHNLLFWRFLNIDMTYNPFFEEVGSSHERTPISTVEELVSIARNSSVDKEWLEDELFAIRFMEMGDEFIEKYNSKKKYVTNSVVAYALGLSDIKPVVSAVVMKVGRVDPPDIDLDFEVERRDEVKNYFHEKWGNTASISTYAKFSSKGLVRDIARVFSLPLPDVNKVCKLFTTLEEFENNQDCKWFTRQYPYVLKIAKDFEGRRRQGAMHAAGVIVADRDLASIIPLESRSTATNSKNRMITTAYDMNDCQEMGLIKIDFLGLEKLTVEHNAIRLIEQRTGTAPVLDDIPLDDKEILEEFSAGHTVGIFQSEAQSSTNLIKRMGIDSFQDLVVSNALVRPGPLSTVGGSYVARKRNNEEITYQNKIFHEITKSTLGLFIFQEQLLEALVKIGGFSWLEADKVRKIIGKKRDVREFQIYEEKWMESASSIMGERRAKKQWDDFEKFAGYAFNNAHSVAYSMISYENMWLKIKFPLEYMYGLLSAEPNKDKLSLYLMETKRMGINLLPPDINFSQDQFSIHNDSILFGLSSVMGVGKAAVGEILSKRPFVSVDDFQDRIDKRKCNKKVFDCLDKVGAFASIGHESKYEPKDYFLELLNYPVDFDEYFDFGIKYDELAEEDKFLRVVRGLVKNVYKNPKFCRVTLQDSSSLVQIYSDTADIVENKIIIALVTGTNLSSFTYEEDFIERYKLGTTTPFEQYLLGLLLKPYYSRFQKYGIGGVDDAKSLVVPVHVKKITTRTNEHMCSVVFSDGEKSVKVIVFPSDYKKYGMWIRPYVPVVIKKSDKIEGKDFQLANNGLILASQLLEMKNMEERYEGRVDNESSRIK